MKKVELVPIDEAGNAAVPAEAMTAMLKENCAATASFYRVVGFAPPWIGYVAVENGRPVGGGAFKGAPKDGSVEIAYYTLPELEGQGFASATARELLRIARSADPAIVITAQTLPVPNASNALLKKLGFAFRGALIHPEDGEVWEWRLDP
jgi:RimJ/RimL family protein N-acetyltransferase